MYHLVLSMDEVEYLAWEAAALPCLDIRAGPGYRVWVFLTEQQAERALAWIEQLLADQGEYPRQLCYAIIRLKLLGALQNMVRR